MDKADRELARSKVITIDQEKCPALP